jgi:hypothetical protein
MQSNTARLGVLAAVIAIGAVLFVVLSGDDDEDSNGDETTAAATQTSTGGETTTVVENESEAKIVFRNDKVAGGVQEIRAEGGDTVFIIVDSDESAEIHVHGYDREAEVEAGQKSQLSFTADLEGVFEVELHLHETGEEVQVGELTVTPS